MRRHLRNTFGHLVQLCCRELHDVVHTKKRHFWWEQGGSGEASVQQAYLCAEAPILRFVELAFLKPPLATTAIEGAAGACI